MNVRALFAQAPYGPKVRALGRTQVLTSPAMVDIRLQLATLLNKKATDIGDIRKTGETPPRVSIYDVVSAITETDGNHAWNAYRDFSIHYSEVHSRGMNFKFPGRGQRNTPVTTARYW